MLCRNDIIHYIVASLVANAANALTTRTITPIWKKVMWFAHLQEKCNTTIFPALQFSWRMHARRVANTTIFSKFGLQRFSHQCYALWAETEVTEHSFEWRDGWTKQV